ncbi:meckelin-like [Tigriopus californicus]|uniref:meckelin-like n=1 Tax=Tigriopus californicus TaxID=6832 RepID=UPI0027DA6416|nr:meckelin-like [Tigriopus californicus]
MKIKIRMLNTREDPKKAGRIYPPIVVIEYGDISRDALEESQEGLDFSFEVNYEMDMKESKKDIEISAGVMSVFAVLWSGVQTWSWSRRSGKVTIDPLTVVKLVLFTCGNLAHIFLIIVFFSSLVWAAFFKFQDHLHVMLPSSDQEMLIKYYIIAIFCLKTVDVIHLIVSQITVDIFLLDWERPKAVSSSGTHGELTKEEAVSVWRTYLVANEWNELQVRRKTNVGLQIIILILLFQVIGLEHYATADPKMSLSFKDGEYHSQYSFVCRFALAVVIYMGVALIQALFWTLIYAGVVENKMEQFADVCSLSNISVFILAANNFGYYIHGKSAHGSADTDMATLIEQLQREADDRCPHRGLQAQTDDQSFTMTLPTKLKSYYDKIVTPATDLAGIKGGPRISKLSGNAIQHMVEAYSTMNKFLTRFLEHALKDLDYEIKDKFVLEKILDVEFQDVNITEKAIFYADSGHSFDAVLFYGNEFSLLTFDMMVFIFVDLFAEDFVLAGVVTFFAAECLNFVRYHLGKQNLARKTLIDKRFLI